MKMRLGAALTGDEAYKMAQERISEKRLSVKADYHAKVFPVIQICIVYVIFVILSFLATD